MHSSHPVYNGHLAISQGDRYIQVWLYTSIDLAKPKSRAPDYYKLTWHEPMIQSKICTWAAANLRKTRLKWALKRWACDMVMLYWSVDTLFSQGLIEHNMNAKYERCTL